MNIVVFTPTYNEAENIELFIKQVFDVLPNCKILVVDDDSADGTAIKVKNLQKSYKNLYLVIRKEKRGRGYAGIEGFKKALELDADIIAEMDADLSHSPYELPKLIDNLIKNPDIDIVVGSRYIKGGKDNERNLIRRFISLFARTYLRIVTGITIRDITSGYKVYRRKVIETILPYLSSSDPFIVTEVNYLCKLFGFKFSEIPIEFHDRFAGKSKLTLWKLVRYLFKVWVLVVKQFIAEKYNLIFLKFLFLTNLLRLLLIGNFGLTDDEAHYWQYSQHLDFSYFDHPPMVGYLIYIFTKIFGNNVYGVRFPAILCFTISLIYFYRLIKEFYDSKVAFYSSVLVSVIPIFFVGSIITIPDAILGMFWMIFIFYFYKFLTTNDTWILYLCGIILGLAGLSKYNAVLLFISCLIILFVNKEFRIWFLKKDFYIFCLIALSVISPIIFWNISHNFISFKYQFFHGVGKEIKFSILLFLQNFGFQALYLSPVIIIFLWYYIFRFLFKKEKIFTIKEQFLLYFALPGIILFNIIAFKNQILPHWPAVSYLTLIPLLSFNNRSFQYLSSLFSALIITVFVILVSMFSIMPIPEKYRYADTPDKLYGWEVTGKEAKNLLETHPGGFIFTHKYYSAGQLRFSISKYYNKNIPQVFCLDKDFNQYDFWYKNLRQYDGRDAIFFSEDRYQQQDEVILNSNIFKSYNLISIINFRKSKIWPERRFKFYICKNFDYQKACKENFIVQKYNNFVTVTEYFRNYDKIIFLKLNKNQLYKNKVFRTMCYIVTNLGNGLVVIPLVFMLLYLVDKRSFLYNAIMFIVIVASGGFIIQILKFLFDKPRPLKLFSDILQQPINVIGEQLRELGFPSGHTFLAFSTAVFLSDRFKNKNISVFLFFIATLVGLSRILVGAHFISDVIGGLIIGIIFTTVVLKIEKEIN